MVRLGSIWRDSRRPLRLRGLILAYPRPEAIAPSTTKGSADWFTGDVWIDPIVQPQGDSPVNIGAVHFTPGARTAWHSHDGGPSGWPALSVLWWGLVRVRLAHRHTRS